ncbi:MAG: DUF975 family protein [Oscillospiraceae bacterium]|jgi:uncharacterized membrane protein|nr:DUF975 family protein [Oscillospiraceae bacterium]
MPGLDLKPGARKLLRDNAPKLFFISIVYIVIVTVMSELNFRLPGTYSAFEYYYEQFSAGGFTDIGAIYSRFRPSGVPLAIVIWILSAVVDVGYLGYCLKISRGRTGEYKDIFDGFLFFGKIVLIKIVTTVLIGLWSLLLVFPGVIAYYRYSQAYYILLDDPKKGVMQCIGESKELMLGKKAHLFLLDLSFLGWVILEYLVAIMIPLPFSLPIVSIWLTPYHSVTRALFYNRAIKTLEM